jgi:hypothetical protein
MFPKFYPCIRFVCGRFSSGTGELVLTRSAEFVRGGLSRVPYPIIYFKINL